MVVTLYNSANAYATKEWDRKDGSNIPDDIYLGRVDLSQDDDWTYQKCRKIVLKLNPTRTPFPGSGQDIQITLYVNPDTGKGVDVKFFFLMGSGYDEAPHMNYGYVSNLFKEQIYFSTTAAGKTMNYLTRSWVRTFP